MQHSVPLFFRFILGFSFAGFLFSGYLTGVKLLSGACAFNETCPILWGHPACWYGFALYTALLLFSFLGAVGRIALRSSLLAVFSVSDLGVIFAGYLSYTELPALLARGFGAYTFGLPTCFIGLIFFILIFLLSVYGIASRKA